MAKKLLLFLLIFIISGSACQLSASTDGRPTPEAVSQLFVTAGANATPTRTPFLPVGPTQTRTPLPAQPKSTAASVTATQQTVTTTNTPEIEVPDKVVNILLLGSDYRPNSGFRTDTIIFLSINPKQGTVSAISFPRDLYVTIPGYGQERINTAEARGGFKLMADTFQANFGIRPQYYVMTNMTGFVQIIDSLKGIEVNASKNLTDKCKLSIAHGGYCSVGPGKIKMDGQTALWYVRSRYSTNDFDRTRRSQEVILGVFNKLISLNVVTRLPELYNIYKSNVETNISVADILPLLPFATQVAQDTSRVHQYAIGPTEVTNWVTAGGAAVLLPRQDQITPLIQRAMKGQ